MEGVNDICPMCGVGGEQMNRGTCDNDDDDNDDSGGRGVGRVMLVDVVVVTESLSPCCVIELLMFLELLMLLWGTPQGLVTPARV